MTDTEAKKIIRLQQLAKYDALIKAYIINVDNDTKTIFYNLHTQLSEKIDLLINEDAEINSKLNIINGDVNTTGSMKNIADTAAHDAVVALIDGAPEALDTLKEIADWIAEEKASSGSATELVSKITLNAQAIAEEKQRAMAAEDQLKTDINSTDGTVSGKIKEAIESLDSSIECEDSNVALKINLVQEDGKVKSISMKSETASINDIDSLFAE